MVIRLDEMKISTGSTTCPALTKIWVTRTVTRDLFALANVLNFINFINLLFIIYYLLIV